MSESLTSKGDEMARRLLDQPLDLPDGTEFSSIAPRMTVQEMVALSEKYLPVLNSQPDFIEKKRKAAFGEPFSL